MQKYDVDKQKLVSRFDELAKKGIIGKERLGILIQEFNLPYSVNKIKDLGNLGQMVSKFRKKLLNWKEEINTEKSDYEIEEDDIVFYTKRKNEFGEDINQRIAIPLEEIKEICKSYSRHGYNKSGTQILQDFNLTTTAWNLIKSRLNITKDSDVIPQNILEIIEEKYGKERVNSEIEEASHKAVINKYKEVWVDKYFENKEKLDDKIRKTYALQEAFLERLSEYIKSGYTPKYSKISVPKGLNSEELILMFTDLHIGKSNTDKVEERMNMIQQDILESKEDKITIVYGGDTFETLVQGGMHPGQTRKLEIQDLPETIMKAVDLFEDFLVGISKRKSVEMYALRGNHDRFTQNNDDDLVRMGAFCFMMLVEERVKNYGVKIHNLETGWNTFESMGFKVIMAHGDYWHSSLSKKKPLDILWEYGNNTQDNLILVGHEHHLEEKDIAKNATVIVCPGLAGAGEYDKMLVKSSYTGYTIIKKKWGKPMTSIIRLP